MSNFDKALQKKKLFGLRRGGWVGGSQITNPAGSWPSGGATTFAPGGSLEDAQPVSTQQAPMSGVFTQRAAMLSDPSANIPMTAPVAQTNAASAPPPPAFDATPRGSYFDRTAAVLSNPLSTGIARGAAVLTGLDSRQTRMTRGFAGGGALEAMGRFLQPAMPVPQVPAANIVADSNPIASPGAPTAGQLHGVGLRAMPVGVNPSPPITTSSGLQPPMHIPSPAPQPGFQSTEGSASADAISTARYPSGKIPAVSGTGMANPAAGTGPHTAPFLLSRRGATGGPVDNDLGGEVAGPGGPRDDMVGPVYLSNKEYVLPGKAYQALKEEKGGKRGLDQWVQKKNDGIPPRGLRDGMAGGGAVAGGISPTRSGRMIPSDAIHMWDGGGVWDATKKIASGAVDLAGNVAQRGWNAVKGFATSPGSAAPAGAGEPIATAPSAAETAGMPRDLERWGATGRAPAADAATEAANAANPANRAGVNAYNAKYDPLLRRSDAAMARGQNLPGFKGAGLAGGHAVGSVMAGAVDSAVEPFYNPEKVGMYAENMGLGAKKDDSVLWQHIKEAGAQGLRTAQNIGNMATFGGADALGQAIARKIGGGNFTGDLLEPAKIPALPPQAPRVPVAGAGKGAAGEAAQEAAASMVEAGAPAEGVRRAPLKVSREMVNDDQWRTSGFIDPETGRAYRRDPNAFQGPSPQFERVTITDGSMPEDIARIQARDAPMYAAEANRQRYLEAKHRATDPEYQRARAESEAASRRYYEPSGPAPGMVRLGDGRDVPSNSIEGLWERKALAREAHAQAATGSVNVARERNQIEREGLRQRGDIARAELGLHGRGQDVTMRGQDIDLEKARASNRLALYERERQWDKEGAEAMGKAMDNAAVDELTDEKGNKTNKLNPEKRQLMEEYVTNMNGWQHATPSQRARMWPEGIRQFKLNQHLQKSENNLLGNVLGGRQVKPGNTPVEIDSIGPVPATERLGQSGTSLIQFPNAPHIKTKGGAYTPLSDVLRDGDMSRALHNKIQMMKKSEDVTQRRKGQQLEEQLEQAKKGGNWVRGMGVNTGPTQP